METTFLDKKDYIKLYTKQAGEDRKNFWKPMLKLGILTFVIYLFIGFISGMLLGDSILSQIIIQIAAFFVTLFSTKYLLNLVDNKKASFEDTFRSFNVKQVLYALLAYILMMIAVSIGYILLIIPGLIVGYILLFVPLISSELTMKPIATLKESRRLTADYKWKLFLTGFSVAIHYMIVPILMVLLYVLSVSLGWSPIIAGIAIAIGGVFYIYAAFALVSLMPRMYRDLQKIKSQETTEEVVDVVVEEVVVETEVVTESK